MINKEEESESAPVLLYMILNKQIRKTMKMQLDLQVWYSDRDY